MIKVIFCGCFGRMGNVVRQIVKEKDNIEIAAGVDICDGTAEFPVYKTITDVKESADVIIDFSSPKALDSILEYATGKNVPAVLCTTGYSEEQLTQISEAAKKVALLRSANMSLGINTLATSSITPRLLFPPLARRKAGTSQLGLRRRSCL